MADDIVQEVKINTAEAEANLDKLGDAGERAFSRIAQGARQADDATASLSGIGQAAPALARVEDAANNFGKSLDNVFDAASNLGKALPSLIGALATAAGAVTTAMFGMAKAAADATDKIRDAAIAAGTTAQAFSKLAFAAEQSGANAAKVSRVLALFNSGAEDTAKAANNSANALTDAREQADHTATSFKRLGQEQRKLQDTFLKANIASGVVPTEQQNDQLRKFRDRIHDAGDAVFKADRDVARLEQSQAAANNETGKGLKAMAKYGVALKNTDGSARDTTEVFKDFADVIAKIPDAAGRASVAAEVLGRRVGPGLVETLSQGRKGIEDLGKTAERLGIVFSDAEIVLGDKFNDALQQVSATLGGLMARIGLAFAPGFIKLFDALSESVAVLSPIVLKVANIIADIFGPAIDTLNRLLGPTGLAVGAFGVALATVAAGASVLLTILGPLGNLLKGALLSPFIKLGTGAVLVVKLLTSSFLSLVAAVRLLGVVALVASSSLTVPIAAIIATIGLLTIAFGGAGVSATNFGDLVTSTFKVINGFIKSFAETWGSVIKGVFIGLKAIYDNVVVPVFTGIMFLATQVANATNNLFGSTVTGAQVLGAALVLLGVAFGGLPILIAALVAGVALLVEKFNENKLVMIAIATAVALLVIAFASVPVVIALIVAAIAFLAAKWDDLKAAGNAAVGAMRQAFEDFGDWFNNTWVGQLISGIKELIKWFANLGKSAKDAKAEASSGTTGGGGQGFAHGGVVRGRGTGTSDSILAWLSNGEGVLTKRALTHYGTRIVHLINSLSLPKAPGFAMGGIVGALANPIPSFAMGGIAVPPPRLPVGSNQKRPVIFQFPDGNEFGAEMDVNTADRMGRYANKRRVSSAGRKPTYYGGGR